MIIKRTGVESVSKMNREKRKKIGKAHKRLKHEAKVKRESIIKGLKEKGITVTHEDLKTLMSNIIKAGIHSRSYKYSASNSETLKTLVSNMIKARGHNALL